MILVRNWRCFDFVDRLFNFIFSLDGKILVWEKKDGNISLVV
jgi:hypothetical protein